MYNLITMPSFLRKCLCIVFFLSTLFGIFVMGMERVYAFDGSVNMSEFVIPTSGSEYTISTGESIRYTIEPGDVGGTVRMYKNANWEQFVNDGSKIRRREDTSWAPGAGGSDVYCTNGNRAIYTLTTDSVPAEGQQVNGSAGWLSSSINFSGSEATANSDSLSIVPLDSVPVYNSNGSQRPYCKLSDLAGYPATGQSQQMKLTYFDSGDFTFCTKITNPNPLIKIEVAGGFGVGDTFLYMKDYGLVGFSDPTGRDAGWMGPGADPSNCKAGGGGSKKISYLNGQVLSSRLLQGYGVSGSKKGAGLSKTISSGLPVEGAVVSSYQGVFNVENQTGKQRGEIKALFASVATNSDGRFSLPVQPGDFEGSNYIAFFCGDKIKDLYKMDVGENINGFSVTIDCDRKESPVKPPSDLQYANRDNWLSCKADNTQLRGKTSEPNVAPTTVLKKEGLDDTYLGTRYTGSVPGPGNIPPVESPQSRRQLDGTASPSAITFSPDALRDAKYTLVGSCYGTLEPPRQNDTKDPKLIDCKYLKECNSPLADSEKGTGRNSQMNSSLSLAFSTPGSYEKRYNAVDPNLAVCNDGSGDVKLGEICPPWKAESECAGYKLGREYFPYDALYSNKNQTIDVDLEMYTINDSGANVTDAGLELWRDQSLQTDTGKADKPYKNRVKSIFPTDKTREWSLPNITCMLSNTCFGYDTKSGGLDSPVCAFNTPGTICGFDSNTSTLDPDIALKKIGRGIYRMGLMESLCTCSIMDPTCEGGQPEMNTFTGQKDFWAAGGYTYATGESQKFFSQDPPPETYYGKKVTGGFFAGLVNLITRFFVWIGNYNTPAKGQCIPKEWKPIGTWCDFKTNPDGCKPECKVVEDGSSCAPSDYCMDVTCTGGNCDSNVEPSPPDTLTRRCTFYEGVDGPYTCSGDIEYPYEGTLQAVSMPGGELASLKEISLLLKSPFDPGSESEVPPLCNFDAAISDAKFPVDQPLVGHDSPCVDGPLYHSDKLRSINRVYIPENPPLNDPDYGGGAGGGDCTPVATISGTHNVKPVEELINAIKTTGYSAQVDYANIRKCYNTVVQTAISSGNDPAFMMATWIEESGAGFYKNAAQFGCKVGTPLDFNSQINCFKQLQSAYANNSNHEGCRKSSGSDALQVLEYLLIFSEGESGCLDGAFNTNPNYRTQINAFYEIARDNGASLNESCTLPKNRWDSTCTSVAAGYCLQPGPYGPTEDLDPSSLSWYTNVNDVSNDDGLTIPNKIQALSNVATDLTAFINFEKNGKLRKLVASDGYRSYADQLQLCNECEAKKAAGGTCLVAPAAKSIHRTGRAVDLYWLENKNAIPIIEGSSSDADEIIQAAKNLYKFDHPFGAGDPPHFEHEE